MILLKGSDIGFDARDLTVDDILFREQIYRVPRYQRPYAWTSDQVIDFWNDITGSSGSYFIGTVIFNCEYQRDDDVIEIIDGQQRLLTLTILMAILRDTAKQIGESALANRIQRKALAVEDKRGSMKFTIACGESTKEFFENFVQSDRADMAKAEPKTTEEKHVKSAYAELSKRVIEGLDKLQTRTAKMEYIQGLWDKLSELKIIRIKINTEDEAYDIFETVNARGVELSAADLVKNLIFRTIRPSRSGADPARRMWNEIQENVEETDAQLTRFLRYYWLSKHAFVTERQLFRAIKRETHEYSDFLSDLAVSSRLFRKLVIGTREDWTTLRNGGKIVESLGGLKIMKATQCHVLLLSIFRNLSKINSDPSNLVRAIENFTYNYSAICKLPTNRVERMYSKYAIEIEKAVQESKRKEISGNVQRIWSSLLKDLRQLRPSREEFLQRFMELAYVNAQDSRRLIKYTLARIDDELYGTGEHKINFDSVNIEHILPQKPEKYWKLARAQIEDYVNKLGNLTLVHKKINSKIGNKSPEIKAVELGKSGIPMTKVVAEDLSRRKAWTKEDIELRQRQFGEKAYDVIWTF